MPIVIEGPDNAGKSSLANDIATRLGGLVIHAGPPVSDYSKMAKDIAQMDLDLANPEHRNDVFDRAACISESVYQNHCGADDLALTGGIQRLLARDTILIYCRPPSSTLMDFSTHLTKAYDTEETMQKIVDNAHLYIERYDEVFSKIPHINFSWIDAVDNKNWYNSFINATVSYTRDMAAYKAVTEGFLNVR